MGRPAGWRGAEIGAAHRLAVLRLLLSRPGITNVEIGDRLGLSGASVSRHVKAIRSAWDHDPASMLEPATASVVDDYLNALRPTCPNVDDAEWTFLAGNLRGFWWWMCRGNAAALGATSSPERAE